MTDITTITRSTWRDPNLGASRVLALPQGRLEAFDSGTGEPIVFVHGLVVNANLWRAVVPHLSSEFRCVTIDLPFGSHRLSLPDAELDPPALARLVHSAINELDLGPVTLVGNDSGGAVCQLIAAEHPEVISRLVLTSCDAYRNFPPKAFWYLKLAARMPGGMTLLAVGMRFRAVRNLPIAYGWLTVGPIDAAASDSYALPVSSARDVRDDLRRVLRGLHSRFTAAAATAFGGFSKPVLLAWSEADRFFPTRHARRLANDFPDARIEWIPGARTLSPEDQPELLATTIATFIRRTSAVSESR